MYWITGGGRRGGWARILKFHCLGLIKNLHLMTFLGNNKDINIEISNQGDKMRK